MITDTISKQITMALKAGDKLRLSTLKLLSSALHNAEIDKRGKLTEEEELRIVRKEVKKRRDAVEAYKKAGALDRASREAEELKILQEFLPKELPREEIEKIVEKAINDVRATGLQDFGKVMGKVMGELKQKADGNLVSEIVKTKLSTK